MSKSLACLILVACAIWGESAVVHWFRGVPAGNVAWGTPLPQDEQAGELDLRALRFRRLESRPEKTIFSPLNLPQPNRIRTATGLPGEDYWQQQVDYQIDALLNTEKESIEATAIVTYTNNSPSELPYLWIALEQNLFRPDSEGAKFTPPGSRFNNREGFQGGLEIHYVRCGDVELPLRIYDTIGRLELPQPVAPRGGKVVFEIKWSFNIPEYGIDRMGIRRVEQGTIFQLAQWFPHVCKFDDVSGWNTLPYLGQGEFYTDFGNYDVTITAPRDHVVCATGVLRNPDDVLTETQRQRLALAAASRQTVVIRGADEIGAEGSQLPGDGPLSWRFLAENVRSFAWTSSNATVWDAAGIQWDDGSRCLVQSVYPRESTAWNESTQMLRHAILTYSDMWFQYPYPSATNVNGNVGGMEYPMIIFCGGDRNRRGLHGVTTHEIGHNWFPMVVNSDERRFAWMDEGFNTFINEYDRFEVYDHLVNGADSPEDPRPFSARSMARLMARGEMQPIALPADQVRPELLGTLQYSKPAVALQMLREVILGPERFDPAFQEYIRGWAFKSPQPADFFRCMENAAGADLAWFWRGWFLENVPLDQAVVNVREARGQELVLVTIANLQEMVMPVTLRIEFADGTAADHRLPVQVWNYTNLWNAEIPTNGSDVIRVTLDPDRVFPDLDRSNNRWEPAAAETPPTDDNQNEGDGGGGR